LAFSTMSADRQRMVLIARLSIAAAIVGVLGESGGGRRRVGGRKYRNAAARKDSRAHGG